MVYDEVTIASGGVPIVLSRYLYDWDAPVIVFLPGTMVHPLFYDSFLAKLARKGFNVIGIHFISHGKSPRIKTRFVFNDLLQNVYDTIGYCRANFSGALFLLGSSQGGILATEAADDKRIRAVFAHDTVLPELPESAVLLRFPGSLQRLVEPFRKLVKIVADVFPGLPVPITLYLETDRVTPNPAVRKRFRDDPLCRKSYPLVFLASLFHADMHVATDGSMATPYILIAAKGDPLFPFDYIKQVYDRIVAPKKELMVFDLPYHILFIEEEAEDTVLEPIVQKIRSFCNPSK